jgi:hypothetical protein
MYDNLSEQVNKLVATHHTCVAEPVPVPAPRDDSAHWSDEPAVMAASSFLQ